MKQLIYILLLFVTFSSCRKSDEKIEELIVGTWEVKSKWSYGLDGASSDFPHCLPHSITFFNNKTYLVNDDGLNRTITPKPFYVVDGKIYMDSLVCWGNGGLIEEKIVVTKINSRKMILSYEFADDGWKYLKK